MQLPPCNSVRLGLILNMSVFYHDVMENDEKAQQLADAQLAIALEKVDDLAETEFQEAKPLIE